MQKMFCVLFSAYVVGLLSVVVAPTALRANDGTIVMRVINVAHNDVLNVRAHPTNEAQILGIIPPTASGVESLGARVGAWVLVEYHGIRGWVHGRYLLPEVASWSHRAAPTESTGLSGSFICVLGSWRLEENAAEAMLVAHDLLPRGLGSDRLKFTSGRVAGQGGIWHRVIIDGFSDPSSAKTLCDQFSREPFQSFVQVNR